MADTTHNLPTYPIMNEEIKIPETRTIEQKVATGDRLDPWIKSDGNIVLETEKKYFCVHRSVLCAHSEVFKDMFDCPAPDEREQERIENCPVVHLHDAADDLQVVLKAMYFRSYPVPHSKKMPLSVVAVFVRLGKKYIIDQLVDEARERLRCAYDTKLDVAARISSWKNGSLELFPGIIDGDPHNFQIINLLEEMGLRASLPLATYQCVITCPLTIILDGYEFRGTTYMLSRENVRSAVLLKDIVERFRTRLIQNLRISTTCSGFSQANCMGNIFRLFGPDGSITKQPLSPFKNEWDSGFCNTCRAGLKAEHNSAIQDAWNKIPAVFGFESWAEAAKSNSSYSSSNTWYNLAQRAR